MFGEMFGFGGGRSQARSRTSRGKDIEVSVPLTFAEAAFGAEKTVELYKPVACSECDGAGIPPGAKMLACKTCGGQGRVRQVQRTILGSFETVATCGACGGVGNVPEKACSRCGGTGLIKETRKLTVKIPAGIDDGETVRIAGEGEAGYRGGRAGDLYLHARVAADKRFQRKGFDIFSQIEIPFSEAALGAVEEVETLDGAVELKITSGIQSGEEIRLKGRGVVRLGSSGRGDHYVRVIVRTPKNPSRKAKDLLQQLRDEGF
jgi:molecular chaperone DnaJ